MLLQHGLQFSAIIIFSIAVTIQTIITCGSKAQMWCSESPTWQHDLQPERFQWSSAGERLKLERI